MRFMVDRVPGWAGRGVDIRIISDGKGLLPGDRQLFNGTVCEVPAYVSKVEFTVEHVEEGTMPAVPVAITLSPAESQQLCDALWDAGVRPSNGEGSTGQLAATQAHLEDMRKLVFNRVHQEEIRQG